MTLMELLERFVAAHEKQAEAAMLMAQGGGCACEEPKPVVHNMTAMQGGATAQGVVQSDGTECTASQPPAEEKPKRQPRKPKDAPTEQPPTQELPPVDPKPETPAEPEITLEALKSAAGLYCARRKVAGSEAPAADCAALLQAHAGVGKTAEVPADKRKACLDAFEANWMPAEEEL